jgi:hypothetical protein
VNVPTEAFTALALAFVAAIEHIVTLFQAFSLIIPNFSVFAAVDADYSLVFAR